MDCKHFLHAILNLRTFTLVTCSFAENCSVILSALKPTSTGIIMKDVMSVGKLLDVDVKVDVNLSHQL